MGASVKFDDSDQEELISEINITPMVDIMLVLLIIFMVTAPAMFTPGIEIEMPEAKTAETVSEQELGILIDTDGNLYVNGKQKTKEELGIELKDLTAEGKEPVVLVGADQNTAHKHVVGVLDFLRENGVYKFAINTQNASSGSEDASDASASQGNSPEEEQ